jgi:hypothetical protein
MTIGHNKGPTMEPGTSWRKQCWTTARAALMPHIPIEILRGRLKRAAELGLDYRTYAGIRAATGCDVVAVLFSSNALGAPAILRSGADRLGDINALRIGLVTPPLQMAAMSDLELDEVHPSPHVLDSFTRQRAALRAALRKTPSDAAVLIGAYHMERDWVAAGKLAGYIDADRYFGAHATR